MEVIFITKIKTKEKTLIPGTFDPVFKEIFTCKECRNYTCLLISKITNIDFDYLKENLVIENTNLPIDRAKEKGKTTDVLLSVEGNIINLEMNNEYYSGLFERNNLYAYRVMSRSMQRGDSYTNYKTLIQINLDSFTRFKKEISVFKMMEVDTHEIESDSFIKYHISLPLIRKKYYNKEKLNDLEKMLFLIVTEKIKDLEKISRGDEILMEYEKKIKDLSDNELFRDLWNYEEELEKEKRTISEYHEKIATEKGLKQGIEQGLKQGIEQGIEQGLKQGREEGIKQGVEQEKLMIAKNMLNDGLDISAISKYTGINESEIKNISKD